jgi:hypothetical protein
MITRALAAVFLTLLVVTPVVAADLPTAKPEQVGLSSERLDRITQVLRADVERGRIPGAIVLVARGSFPGWRCFWRLPASLCSCRGR